MRILKNILYNKTCLIQKKYYKFRSINIRNSFKKYQIDFLEISCIIIAEKLNHVWVLQQKLNAFHISSTSIHYDSFKIWNQFCKNFGRKIVILRLLNYTENVFIHSWQVVYIWLSGSIWTREILFVTMLLHSNYILYF